MKVLAVIDMQKDFVDGSLGTKEASAIVSNVMNKVNSYDGMVVFTRDTHYADYLESAEGKHLPVVHCVRDTEGWNLIPELDEYARQNHCMIFDKPTFGSTELAQYMLKLGSEKEIEEIELIGLCTDICVISNALMLKAHLPEVEIKVDAACCAGVTPQSHDNALSAMEMCQITVNR